MQFIEGFFKFILLAMFVLVAGSISGVAVAYTSAKKDYELGNSVTNVFRDCGIGYGLLAFAIDVAKGAASAFLAWVLFDPYTDLGVFMALVLVLLFNSHSVLLAFNGSKGIAPYLGVLYAVDWRIGVVATVLGVIWFIVIKRYEIAAVVATVAAAVAVCIVAPKAWFIVLAWLVVVYVVWMNFGKLFPKFSKPKRKLK